MASNPGKVSFSFSKINIKKPSLNVQPKEIVKKVDKIQYIDCIEDNSVNVINGEEEEVKQPLVIPLQHPNLLLQSVIDTVKSRKENENNETVVDTDVNKEEVKDECESEKKPESLEEMAARELIEDATQKSKKETSNNNLTVPLATLVNNNKESNLDDYENIPIADFGLAMLRGMGWDPKKGIGKNGKVVKVAGPSLRPKGLGLGADKAIAAQKPVGKNVSKEEVLAKGSNIRITVGQYKNLYGTVIGFNDDTGRIDVHMAISNEKISINECFVQLVTPDEFGKYSKVININAYNNYKDREENKKTDSKESVEHLNKTRAKSPDVKSKQNQNDNRYLSSMKHKKDNKLDSDSENDHRKSSKSTKYKKESKYRDSSSNSEDESCKEKQIKMKYKKESKYRDSSSNSDNDTYNEKQRKSKYKKEPKYKDSSFNSDDDSYNEKQRKQSNTRNTKYKKESKHRDSSSDSDYKKHSKSKSKTSSSSYNSKHVKKYSSKGNSSDHEKYRSKHRHKDSRRKSSSGSDRDPKHRNYRRSRSR